MSVCFSIIWKEGGLSELVSQKQTKQGQIKKKSDEFSIVMPIRENLQISHKEFLSTEKILKEDKTINILDLLRAGLSKLGRDGGNTFISLFSEFNFFSS